MGGYHGLPHSDHKYCDIFTCFSSLRPLRRGQAGWETVPQVSGCQEGGEFCHSHLLPLGQDFRSHFRRRRALFRRTRFFLSCYCCHCWHPLCFAVAEQKAMKNSWEEVGQQGKCFIPPFSLHVGRGFEQPGLVEGVPARGRGVGTRWSLRSILWFYDHVILILRPWALLKSCLVLMVLISYSVKNSRCFNNHRMEGTEEKSGRGPSRAGRKYWTYVGFCISLPIHTY